MADRLSRSPLDITPRRKQAFASLALTVLLIAVVSLLPVPYVTFSPGPTYNSLGAVKGKTLLEISGRKVYPTTGSLDMVTVHQMGGPDGDLSVIEALRAWLDPASEVVPTSAVFQPGETRAEMRLVSTAQFTGSQSDAVAAAMSYLKIPTTTTVVVSAVVADMPAEKKLEAADQIISVNGVRITKPKQVSPLVRKAGIGGKVTMQVRRAGKPLTFTLTTVENPRKPGVPFVGIMVDTYTKAPFTIAFELSRVGGPSAGTVFAVALIDKLTPGDMTGGEHIVGTGTIDADGYVGGIGGIAQKMVSAKRAGGTLFLAPAENCPDVIGHIPNGLQVVQVATLADAVKAVTAYGKGQRTGAALKPCTTSTSKS